MQSFMLLLYGEDNALNDLAPEEMQQILEKYRAWHEKLEREGKLLGSDKLKDGEGKVIERGGARVIDGPYSETKEVVGGYFAIQAADYDAAVAIAKTCPHVDFGTTEVRAIDNLDDA